MKSADLTVKVLIGLSVAVAVGLLALGSYYFFFIRGSGSNKTSIPKNTQTKVVVPQVVLTETVGITKLPDGWEVKRCGEPIWFANPKSLGIDCAKALNGDAAISLFLRKTAPLDTEKNQSGKTIIKVSDSEYLVITLKKPEYEAQYKEIVSQVDVSVAVP